MGKQKNFLSRRQAALLIPVVLSMLWASFVFSERRAANHGVRIEFVCVTNVPGMGPQALLKVTNLTPDQIFCQNYGWLEPGESGMGEFPFPAGTGPSRVPVRWWREDPNLFEEQVNRLRYELRMACGKQNDRNRWLPLERVSYSAEIIKLSDYQIVK